MFIEPDPRPARRPQSQIETSSYVPPAAANSVDQRIIRKPLLEKTSNSKIKQDVSQDEEQETPLKPTVRLVKQSPSVADIKKNVFGETDTPKRWSRRYTQGQDVSRPGTAKDAGARIGVSDETALANDSPRVDTSLDDSWQDSDIEANDTPSWKRRSVSSSNLSDATTLKGSSIARFSYNHSTHSRSTRISSGTTLQDNFDSSVLHETDLDDLPETASEAGPLPEDSPSVTEFSVPDTPVHASTIRTVQSSEGRDEDNASHLTVTPRPVSSRRNSWSSPSTSELVIDSSPPLQPTQFIPSIPPRLSSKHASSASIGSGSVLRRSLDLLQSSPASAEQDTSVLQHSPQTADLSTVPFDNSNLSSVIDTPSERRDVPGVTSSPNFLAFSSSPVRPRSRSHPLRGEASFESIASRLQGRGRADNRRSVDVRRSWASLDQSSSQESLPSIHVSRRRLRQVRGSLSLDATSRYHQPDSDLSMRDLSGNLSTIMSESERSRSRTLSHQVTPLQLDGTSRHGYDSTPRASVEYGQGDGLSPVPSFESYVAGSSDEDEPGDMTLNLYREASAKPAPLFRPEAFAESALRNKRYNGPLPPLPPIPTHDAEEHLDRVAELTSPDLRPKRSGYSLRRQRSSSTPMHARHLSGVSNNDSDRWSISSNIFPTWARHFYSGNIALASMSMISLQSSPQTPTRDGAQNGMRLDQRPGLRSPNSTAPASPSTNFTKSPRSGKFIPAIFRPRTRPLRKSIGAVRDLIRPVEQRRASTNVAETPERDSMAIEAVTPTGTSDGSHLPSGHPKYGDLQVEGATPPRPLPRVYSKQKRWNEISFPRPMSKDQRTNTDLNPHLASSKHSSRELDAWRPPSFVDSIDLIFKSQGHRQILFFLLGFLCPFMWMVGAVMPLPERPVDAFDPAKITPQWLKENTNVSLDEHEADEAAVRWRDEKAWRQGVWWRNVNRVMSVVGLLIIGAVIAIAIVATR